jgi:hypothetical protein
MEYPTHARQGSIWSIQTSQVVSPIGTYCGRREERRREEKRRRKKEVITHIRVSQARRPPEN